LVSEAVNLTSFPKNCKYFAFLTKGLLGFCPGLLWVLDGEATMMSKIDVFWKKGVRYYFLIPGINTWL
jgi:hypothetical protein